MKKELLFQLDIAWQMFEYHCHIKSTQESDKWIFMRNGERMTTRQAAYILKLFADENGSKVKSSHKLRKTCGSNLFKNGASAQQCSDYLGNSNAIWHLLLSNQSNDVP